MSAALEKFYGRYLADDVDSFALPADYAAGFYTMRDTLRSTSGEWAKGHVKGDPCDEFVVKPSPRSIEREADALLSTEGATRADMAVALRKLQQEISERKRTEELQRESEAVLKKILDSLEVGVAIVDANSHEILPINPKALALFGAPLEQVVGRVCHRFICPAMNPAGDLGMGKLC